MPPATCLGQSAILRMTYAKQDLSALTAALVRRVVSPEPDLGAMMDLATILQARGAGWEEEALGLQRQAVANQPVYRTLHGKGTGPRVLALVMPGNFMTNTPVDFLLAGSDAELILYYITEQTTALHLPPHDAAMLAIGESAASAPVLARIAPLIGGLPLLNNAPGLIATLTRDHVSDLMTDQPGLHAPRTCRLTRDQLQRQEFPPSLTFPMLLRPMGSHAGLGLDQIIDAEELTMWLGEHAVEEVYAAPFIDYRGPDGYYSKQRVVLIGGRPYPGHLAASDHWMVHYLNADMESHPERRAIEAAWMADFETYAARHATAFASLYRIFPLDYFGIDCAEGPDGRLLVFEVDVAMIVHDMHDPGPFSYKTAPMRRLFDAFLALCETKGAVGPGGVPACRRGLF